MDGRSIFFTSNREPAGIWEIPVGGGEATPVDGRELSRSPDGAWIYYLGENTAWKEAADDERRVDVPELRGHFHDVAQGQIFYIGQEIGERLRPFSIWCYDMNTEESKAIANIDELFAYGFSVSPDGETLLYSAFDRTGSDLMLVENFR